MLEERTADTILQKPIEVSIGDKKYKVAKPTLATLIEVSRYIAKLPNTGTIEKKNIVPFILSNAKDCGLILANIAAVMIIGAQNIKKVAEKRKKWRFLWFYRNETRQVSNVDLLSQEISNNLSCEDLNNIISQTLSHQSIGFFLSSIISLSGASVSEKTKDETKATAHGE